MVHVTRKTTMSLLPVRTAALGARHPATLKQGAGVTIAYFKDPTRLLKKGARLTLTGRAKAKHNKSNVHFTTAPIPVC